MGSPHMTPGSDAQWVFAVSEHLEQRGQFYAVMVRMDGMSGLDGPYATWEAAEQATRVMAEGVASMGGGTGTFAEIRREGNHTTHRVRNIGG